MPEGLDGQAILKDAIGRKVAFVPGGAFYVDGRGTHGMRLSSSVVEPERIEEGIKRLGGVVKEHMRTRALEPTVAAP